MNGVYLSLGSNIGDKEFNLQVCRSFISELAGTIVTASPLYRTAPWKMDNAGDFVNQALFIATTHEPEKLLGILLEIEKKSGRVRSEKKYQSRIIDIDILFYNNDSFSTENITIPHPLISARKFVLQPLSDIAADYIHPQLHKTVNQLLAECTDDSEVTEIKSK